MNPIVDQLKTTEQNPLMQNPNYSMVMNMVKGRDPKEVFYEECQKRNVDPNTILSQIK